jgi:hypothetical protein
MKRFPAFRGSYSNLGTAEHAADCDQAGSGERRKRPQRSGVPTASLATSSPSEGRMARYTPKF